MEWDDMRKKGIADEALKIYGIYQQGFATITERSPRNNPQHQQGTKMHPIKNKSRYREGRVMIGLTRRSILYY
jgi:hypothetical protein